MCQMKASLINIRFKTSRYSAGSYAFAVKGLCALFSAFKIRSGTQFDTELTCLRSVETNLTLTCPSAKSFVCNLPDSWRHVTSVFQGLSPSRSIGRVGENPGNEVELKQFFTLKRSKGFPTRITWQYSFYLPNSRHCNQCPPGSFTNSSPKRQGKLALVNFTILIKNKIGWTVATTR